MPLAICPGSYDPVTVGHVDVLRRAAALFGQVVALVSPNSAKQCLFTPAQRLEQLRAAAETIPGVQVDCSGELLAAYARRVGATVLVKGVRDAQDLAYEQTLAQVNRHLEPTLDTVFLPADPAFAWVSSTVVREMLRYGQDITDLVPAAVREILLAQLQEEKQDEH